MILKQISKGDNHYLKKTTAILNGGWGCRTQFLKGHTRGPSMPSLAPFGQAVSEEKIFLTLANQKQELFLAAMFIGQMERNGETL
jgi:hypothetical protein